jgi:hypothetical protein
MKSKDQEIWEQELRHNREIVLWSQRSQRWKNIVLMYEELMENTRRSTGLQGDQLLDAVCRNSDLYLEIQNEIDKAHVIDGEDFGGGY